MATKDTSWEVDILGSGTERVRLERTDGTSCDTVMRLTRDGETVTVRVTDGTGAVVGDRVAPEWVVAATEAVGVRGGR